MSRTCTDCFWCKINRSKGYVRCRVDDGEEKPFSHWQKQDGSEKRVRLTYTEVLRAFVGWRDAFEQAEKCPSFFISDYSDKIKIVLPIKSMS